MADNADLAALAGNVACDEVPYSGDSALVQLMRLVKVTGAEGSKVISPFRDLKVISVASAGVTSAPAHSTGDQVGNLFSLADAALESGGGGTVVGVSLVDAEAIMGVMDLLLFEESVTLAADNAAFAISDADALKLLAVVHFNGPYSFGGQYFAQAQGLSIPYRCVGGTTLYGALVLRGGVGGSWTVSTSLQLKVLLERN